VTDLAQAVEPDVVETESVKTGALLHISELMLLPDVSQWAGRVPDLETIRRTHALRIREVHPNEWRVHLDGTWAWSYEGGWVDLENADVMDLTDATDTAHELMAKLTPSIHSDLDRAARRAELDAAKEDEGYAALAASRNEEDEAFERMMRARRRDADEEQAADAISEFYGGQSVPLPDGVVPADDAEP
jgi:hypothetical protein